MSKITKLRLNPVWHRMLYSCTHMATVGFKGLNSVIGPSTANHHLVMSSHFIHCL